MAVDGGDERARAREGESIEGRRGRERVRGRSEGAAWLHPKRPGRSGKQEVAGAASALATEQLQGEGEEDDREEERWAGPTVLGRPGGLASGKRQVSSFSLSLLFLFNYVFYFL